MAAWQIIPQLLSTLQINLISKKLSASDDFVTKKETRTENVLK
jgi:hypothetical protein